MTAFQKPDTENRLAFINEQKPPAVITAAQGESLQELLTSASGELRAIQRRYGTILFRGFALNRETRNRHRGESHLSAPATPPDMRVRIRRFGGIELEINEQPGNAQRVEVWDWKRIVHRGTVGYAPWAVAAPGCWRSQIRPHSMLA